MTETQEEEEEEQEEEKKEYKYIYVHKYYIYTYIKAKGSKKFRRPDHESSKLSPSNFVVIYSTRKINPSVLRNLLR